MRKTATFLCVLGLLTLAGPVWGAATYWKGPTGDPLNYDWSTTTNWTAGLPDALTSANIGNTTDPSCTGGTVNVTTAGCVCDAFGLGKNLDSDLQISGVGHLAIDYGTVYTKGAVHQTGGTYTSGRMTEINSGTYYLQSGTLAPRGVNLFGGLTDRGTLDQTGGLADIGTYDLNIGGSHYYDGLYLLSGGTLDAHCVHMDNNAQRDGKDSSGRWEITHTNGKPLIIIREGLYFGTSTTMTHNDCELTAVTGTDIYMTGSQFENLILEGYDLGTDRTYTGAADLAGLNDVTLIYTGGDATTDDFEVAGKNLGCLEAGLTGNFALEGLTLGGDPPGDDPAGTGHIKLVDAHDNRLDVVGEGNECLYVENLTINTGSQLDLGGKWLFYLNGPSYSVGDGKVSDSTGGGGICQIPEPTALALLVLGGLGVLRRRRR